MAWWVPTPLNAVLARSSFSSRCRTLRTATGTATPAPDPLPCGPFGAAQIVNSGHILWVTLVGVGTLLPPSQRRWQRQTRTRPPPRLHNVAGFIRVNSKRCVITRRSRCDLSNASLFLALRYSPAVKMWRFQCLAVGWNSPRTCMLRASTLSEQWGVCMYIQALDITAEGGARYAFLVHNASVHAWNILRTALRTGRAGNHAAELARWATYTNISVSASNEPGTNVGGARANR